MNIFSLKSAEQKEFSASAVKLMFIYSQYVKIGAVLTALRCYDYFCIDYSW